MSPATTKPKTYRTEDEIPKYLHRILHCFNPNRFPNGATWSDATNHRYSTHHRNALTKAVRDGLFENLNGDSYGGPFRLTEAGIALLKLCGWEDERTGNARLDVLAAQVVDGEGLSGLDADDAVRAFYDALADVEKVSARLDEARKREMQTEEAARAEAARLGVPVPERVETCADRNRKSYEESRRALDRVLEGAPGARAYLARARAPKTEKT